MGGDQRWDETWHRLLNWTNGQAPSERLAAQVLLAEGYSDLDPRHPLGGRDGGADAIAYRDGQRWAMAVYFPRGQQLLTEITKKFVGDFEGVAKNDADGVAFVTNQELRDAERRDLVEAVDGEAVIYHLERLVAILDQPKMYGVRHQFLSIEIPAASQLDSGEALAEMHRASLGRCTDRWMAVGLPRDEAQALSADASVGAPPGVRLPDEQAPVVVWTAVMGSGKSIAAERYHQRVLEAATREADSPVPVFLAAAECAESLEHAASARAEEIGQPRRQGAQIIIDGVDEVGHQIANQLLTQARVLTAKWPSTTVLLTSRPVAAFNDAPEHAQFPPLGEEEQLHCVEIGAGEGFAPADLFNLPQAVKATLEQPLFALLTGLWIRKRSYGPRAPMDLMQVLGEHATRDLDVDQSHLRRLAVLSVQRDLASVPAAEALEAQDRDPLLATGMVVEEAGGLRFVLPAIAQWFAAQALMAGEVEVEALLRAPEDLELWRYPMGLVVAMGSPDQTRQILSPLLEGEPGFGLRVLDTAVGQAVLEGVQAPPWREAGERIREALQGLADALRPLAPMVLDTTADGRVLPIGVSTAETRLTVGFWRGRDTRPDVFALPAEVVPFNAGPGWGTVRFSHVGPGAAWAWNWSLEGLKRSLDRTLRARALPLPLEGPLADEEVWATACDLTNRSTFVCDRIELEPLEEILGRVPDEIYEEGPVVMVGPRGPNHDLRGLRLRVRRLREAGAYALTPSLLPADLEPGGGYIGEFYSDQRLLEIGTSLYEQVLIGYTQLVERWLPNLRTRLEHYVLLPARVVGFVDNGRRLETGGFGGPIPSLAGFVEPLAVGRDSEVVMQMSEGYDYDLGEHLYAQQQAARPEAARWLTGTQGGMSFEIGARYPVSDAVYRWLVHDLRRLGLAGALTRIRSAGAVSPWDLASGV